jgi:hypothetical protein
MVISKTKYNNQEEQEEASDEYQTDNQYEKDILADDNAHSEYIEDDGNKADRFLMPITKIL